MPLCGTYCSTKKSLRIIFSLTSTILDKGTTARRNMMVPQLANIATVDSLQSKAYWAPLSIGPQVFQTMHCINHVMKSQAPPRLTSYKICSPDGMPSHRKAPEYTSVLYTRVAPANLLYYPHLQSPSWNISLLYSIQRCITERN